MQSPFQAAVAVPILAAVLCAPAWAGPLPGWVAPWYGQAGRFPGWPRHPIGRLPPAPVAFAYYPARPAGQARPGPVAGPARPPTAVEPAAGPPAATEQAPVPEPEAFIAMLLPVVQAENRRLLERRDQLQALLAAFDAEAGPSEAQRQSLARMAARYRVDGDVSASPQARSELLARVDAIPASLALAQAANESGWGSSRFAREGRNLFGIWTYDPALGMQPLRREPGKRHLVRKFDSYRESVRHYMHTLNSHPAYRRLREIRRRQRGEGDALDGLELASGLERYSQKGEEYVRLIRRLITDHDLVELDRAAAAG